MARVWANVDDNQPCRLVSKMFSQDTLHVGLSLGMRKEEGQPIDPGLELALLVPLCSNTMLPKESKHSKLQFGFSDDYDGRAFSKI